MDFGRVGEALVTIASLIVGVAIISVLVSPKATTSQVIQAAASGFGNNLATAIAPVTGAVPQPNLSYPSGGGGMGLPSFGGSGAPGFY